MLLTELRFFGFPIPHVIYLQYMGQTIVMVILVVLYFYYVVLYCYILQSSNNIVNLFDYKMLL